MDVSSLLSAPPPTKNDLPEYLDRVAAELADLIASRLAPIVERAYNRFLASLPDEYLTATGNYGAFDDIPITWLSVLRAEIVPAIEQTYLASAVTAFVTASDRAAIPEQLAENFIALVNNSAVDYARERLPELVGIGDAVRLDVSGKVADAIATGATPEELKRQLERVINTTEYRADTVARTEVGIAWNTADFESAKELGEYGPIEKVWRTTGDDRVRDSHLVMDGVRLPFDEPFNVDGSIMDYPQDPSGDVSEIVNCRCYLDEYYAGDEREDGTIVGQDDVATDDE